jgi:CubicO group peptidase (beta-lactamase class C family)
VTERTGGEAQVVDEAGIGGHVEPGFEAVADAFAENFAIRGEVGAAFAATLDGRPVVDLWGGVADSSSGRRWREDTLQLVFSGTKGFTALCMAMLIDRGQLNMEEPVCSYWPHFAAKGKQEITVAEVFSHRCRLPGLHQPLSRQDVLDPQRIAELLAARAPESDPRAGFIYHAITYGWLCDGLMRHIDGRSIGRFFADEVAGPLGLEIWIGLPAELEPRVAVLQYGRQWLEAPLRGPDPLQGDALWASIYENPPLFSNEEIPWNRREFHATEIAAANGIGTARSIARLYGALVRGGELDGVRLLSAETVALIQTPLAEGREPFGNELKIWGAGFGLQTEKQPLGPVSAAFGANGAGGSTHGAWPQERVGLSYAMNEMREYPGGDERARALLDALLACLG